MVHLIEADAHNILPIGSFLNRPVFFISRLPMCIAWNLMQMIFKVESATEREIHFVYSPGRQLLPKIVIA